MLRLRNGHAAEYTACVVFFRGNGVVKYDRLILPSEV